MTEMSNFGGAASALPAELLASLAARTDASGKRLRTRTQLLLAAVQVFSSRGVALATLQEVASVAGVANGTVYNHFASKEALVAEVGGWLADGLCQAIHDSYGQVREGAERMA